MTADLTEIRFRHPEAIGAALRARTPFPGLDSLAATPSGTGSLLLIAADHPARGALDVAGDPMAMADRGDLIDRIVEALGRPGVHGFLGAADLIEELTLRGALEGKLVLGSMNRGGISGATFALDDRFTAYSATGIAKARLDGGKMLLRIDPSDPATAATLQSCAHAVDDLADQRLIALVEPFLCRRDGAVTTNILTPEAVIRTIAIASGLGNTSAYTWLKVPCVAEMERVMAATTLPTLILGGEVSRDTDATLTSWGSALRLPGVRGLVVGRALLYPPDGDVAGAVDAAASLL